MPVASTIPEFHAIEINTLALELTRSCALAEGRVAVKLSLSSLPFGMYIALHWCSICHSDKALGILAILSLASIFFLS